MRLRYTSPALADLSSLLDYISEHSPRSALRVQKRLQARIELTLRHPKIGVPTDDPTVRKLVVTPNPYLVFYEVRPGEILIHAIRHSARDREQPVR